MHYVPHSFTLMMITSCTLNSESFTGKTAGDAFLDAEWKCRVCNRFAGQHPTPISPVDVQLTGNTLLSLAIPALIRAPNFTLSSTVSVVRCYPSEIHFWEDFPIHALGFHDLDQVILIPNRLFSLDDRELITESEQRVEENFIRIFARNLTQLSYLSNNYLGIMSRRSVFPVNNHISGRPDIVCYHLNNLFAVGELKSFWNLENMPSDVNEMISIYARRNQIAGQDFERNNRKWWRCLAQINGYMIDNQVRYGFISGFNRTWFIRAEASNELNISRAFLCDSGEAVRAFAYFLRLAKVDWENGVRNPTTQNKMIRTPPSKEEAEEEEGGGGGGGEDSHEAPNSEHSHGYDTRAAKKRSASSFLSSKSFIAKRFLSLGECENFHYLGEGRLGIVLGCRFQGENLAVKCVDITKDDVAALEKEISMYRKLEAFQGELIPKVLYYHCESVSGMMSGFAMQCLDRLPDEWIEWDSNLRSKAYDCLLALATSAGIIHNDIRPCNFGLLNGGKVMVFDLEDVIECRKDDYSKLSSFKKKIQQLIGRGGE